ncbi:MAG: tetratricopeptide repeat protein [Candidatus Eremiobacteraeota bacterium]|nr:tetratricopeptide repeat protein [Candidatus Eremiobacteraeota bacterium]
MEYFSRKRAGEILGVSPGRLRYWEKLGLAESTKSNGEPSYPLTELIRLRAIDRLVRQGARPRTLAQPQLRESLGTARLECHGRRLVVFADGQGEEVLSGQLMLDFDDSEAENAPRRLRPRQDWQQIACEARARGDVETAVEALHELVRLRPSDVESHNQLGILLLDAGRPEEAAGAFRQALWLAPGSSGLRFNLANALDEMGDLEAARAELERVLSMDSNFKDAHFNLALVLEKLERGFEAYRHWKRYLQLDPAGPWAEKVRSLLRHHTGGEVIPLRPGCR